MIYICISIHLRLFMYVCMYVCCMIICIYVCIYIYMYTYDANTYIYEYVRIILIVTKYLLNTHE